MILNNSMRFFFLSVLLTAASMFDIHYFNRRVLFISMARLENNGNKSKRLIIHNMNNNLSNTFCGN